MANITELKTRVVLRNDSTANWLAAQDTVLLQGEVGIEFTEAGKVRIKIGDGAKPWSQLEYFGGEFEHLENAITNLTLSVAGIEAKLGEVPENKTLIELIADKANAADVYTKTEIDGLIGTVYNYKGTVSDYSMLPTKDNRIGDVYNVENKDSEHGIHAGDNVAWNGTNWDRLSGTIDLSGYATEEDLTFVEQEVEASKVKYQQIKYEVTSKPVGTVVDYREKEIRILCPEGTIFTQQNSGAGADASRYYIGIKIYAPNDNIVSFKEDTRDTILDDTMYTFDGEFAGIDSYGRKYSIIWLPVAELTAEGVWEYHGKASTTTKYLGWYYTVEWYDDNNIMVSTETIRINLSNEACHNNIKPYYMGQINVNNLVQTEGEELILNGGLAQDY